MILTSSVPVAWWSRLTDAAGRLWHLPAPWLERLIARHEPAWRRRWLGIGAAWLLCLIGWAGTLLAPSHYRSAALLFADPGPQVGPEGDADRRASATLQALRSALLAPVALERVVDARQRLVIELEAPTLLRVSYWSEQPEAARRALQTLVELVMADQVGALAGRAPGAPGSVAADLRASRVQAAALRSDLAAALTLRAARARQLAEMPPVLEAGRRNPVHAQVELQLGQQDILVASLRSQLATTEARSAGLERRLQTGSPGRASAGALRGPPAAAPADGAASADRPILRLVAPPSLPTEPEGVPRLLLLAGVLLVGVAGGAAAAAWRGRLDGIVDDAAQLERRFALPVLATITLPTTPDQRRRQRRARVGVGLACLGLLGLFGSLAAGEALDLLAPLAERLRGSAPG